ncbi:hypothetical protein ABTX15_01220 [Micromonospora sp. NPDC094482]|uniref:hypothetical protein n=1 Tax=unclassified Micromonospora TaxID=2617518 RepID=UPI00332F7A03
MGRAGLLCAGPAAQDAELLVLLAAEALEAPPLDEPLDEPFDDEEEEVDDEVELDESVDDSDFAGLLPPFGTVSEPDERESVR